MMPNGKLIALVLGGADCLHDDRRRAEAMFEPDTIIATNGAGIAEPGPLKHWVTMHPNLFPIWMAERRKAGRSDAQNLWCRVGAPAPPHLTCRRVHSWGGSSGLLAVAVGLELGYLVVCCGVPLDKTPHFDDPKRTPWKDGPNYRPAWVRRRAALGDVRSMSGWTAELLGQPTQEWLTGA